MFIVVVEWLQKNSRIDHLDEHSAGTSEGAALIGHDDDTKEEEVYQDLCSIQNGVRSQVFVDTVGGVCLKLHFCLIKF